MQISPPIVVVDVVEGYSYCYYQWWELLQLFHLKKVGLNVVKAFVAAAMADAVVGIVVDLKLDLPDLAFAAAVEVVVDEEVVAIVGVVMTAAIVVFDLDDYYYATLLAVLMD